MNEKARAKNTGSTEPAKKTSENEATQEAMREAIRRRAYEIYCTRNEAPGSEIEDWLQAERELNSAG